MQAGLYGDCRSIDITSVQDNEEPAFYWLEFDFHPSFTAGIVNATG
jgi:hypothetical protein